MAASEKLDRSLEEAARSLGASQWRITWDVIVPGLQPALLSTGALCFATSMGAFGTAFTLGTDLAVLPLTILWRIHQLRQLSPPPPRCRW